MPFWSLNANININYKLSRRFVISIRSNFLNPVFFFSVHFGFIIIIIIIIIINPAIYTTSF